MEYGFVYIWRDSERDRYYIGSHYGHRNDRYVSSSQWLNAAYRRRPETFRRRILYSLCEPNLRLLQEVEARWLALIPEAELSLSRNVVAKQNRYYNMKRSARGGNGTANRGKSKPGSNRLLWKLRTPEGEIIITDRLYDLVNFNSYGFGLQLRYSLEGNRPVLWGKFAGWQALERWDGPFRKAPKNRGAEAPLP
jgi:hypothetical protein